MRLSKKGEYAVRALIEFGVCNRMPNPDLLQISVIAQRTHIPEKFLEQILLALKNGGILKSKRGVDGGYCLNRPVETVTVGEVIRLMDGPLAPIPCVSKSAYEPCNCPDEASCGLRVVMQQVRDAIASILDNYTLKQLVTEVQKRKQKTLTSWQFDI
jgi:Rrf2 family protein